MPPRGRRPTGGPDTRGAILDAARALFAERGVERTTMRAVATRADVDPALIHHYFGTKDGLLREALSLPIDPSVVLRGLDVDREHAGVEVVRRILGVWEAEPEVRARMTGMLRASLSHEHAADLMRETLGRTVLAALGDLVEPDHRDLRAALVGSHLGGLLLGRYVIAVPGLADAPADVVVAAVGPALQHYLTGAIDAPARRTA